MTIEFTYPSQYPRFDNNPWKEAAEQLKPPALTSTLPETSASRSSSEAVAQDTGGNSFFEDLLDIINPLQQLPVIGTIYRHLTGDTLSPVSRLAGGALLGGPIGFVVAAVNAALEDGTGKDAAGHLIAMVTGADTTVQVASDAYGKANNLG